MSSLEAGQAATPNNSFAQQPKVSSGSAFAKLDEKKDILSLVLRSVQAVLAVIGIICLGIFDASTTILGSLLIILLPRYIAVPAFFPLIVTVYDFVYLWFWIGAAGSVASISTWCSTWQGYGVKAFNCSGLGGAAAMGFFLFFSFIFAILLDFLPVITNKVTLTNFVNGRTENPDTGAAPVFYYAQGTAAPAAAAAPVPVAGAEVAYAQPAAAAPVPAATMVATPYETTYAPVGQPQANFVPVQQVPQQTTYTSA
ncbi:hypothetical protein HDU97_008797 [Phlyctochytrium planicorne]|nr:hypothetical protein HDU97_008797 [Phlyctochytrium planicorne]